MDNLIPLFAFFFKSINQLVFNELPELDTFLHDSDGEVLYKKYTTI